MNILVLGQAQRNQPVIEAIKAAGDTVQRIDTAIDATHVAHVDWIVVNGYAPILKRPVIEAVSGRVINVHPTFLPFGRGIFPLFWAIFYGWPTGVSLHQIDEGIDTGALYAQREVQPDFTEDTLRTFNNRLLEAANRLFIDSWPTLRTGEKSPQKQNLADPSLVSKSRFQSEAFVELLPHGWETPLETVRRCGKRYRENMFVNAEALL